MAFAQFGGHLRSGGTLGDIHVDRTLTGALTQHRKEPDLDSHVIQNRTFASIGYIQHVQDGQESHQPDALTHVDADGNARMVDVGDKAVTDRRAKARARVRMLPATARLVADGDAPKGDVIATARLAGIMAAKRTGDLIPLAHPIGLSFVDVSIAVDVDTGVVSIETESRTSGQTGVEMEAITAAAMAAVTVYDMVKGVERGVTIEQIELLEKSGGKSDWHREG